MSNNQGVLASIRWPDVGCNTGAEIRIMGAPKNQKGKKMVIKNAVYDTGCPSCGCGKKIVTDTVYGCDYCRNEMDSPYNQNRTNLEITVFYLGGREADNLHFCSWRCVFEFMTKMQKTKYKCDYFVSLPIVKFDGDKPGHNELIKELRGARRTLMNAPVQQTTAKGKKPVKS